MELLLLLPLMLLAFAIAIVEVVVAVPLALFFMLWDGVLTFIAKSGRVIKGKERI